MSQTFPTTVASFSTLTPPASPGVNYYIVPSNASGAWASNPLQIAWYENGAWKFAVPTQGLSFWVSDQGSELTWNGTSWVGQAQGGLTDIFASYYGTISQSIPATTWTALNFETKSSDTNNACTVSPWKFTAPETGVYTVSVNIWVNTPTTRLDISIALNGAAVVQGSDWTSPTTIDTVSQSIPIQMNKGDNITLSVYSTTATTLNVSNTGLYSRVIVSRTKANIVTTTIGGTQASGMIPQLNSVGQLDPSMVPTGTTLGGSILQSVPVTSASTIAVPFIATSTPQTYANSVELANLTFTPKSTSSIIKVIGYSNIYSNSTGGNPTVGIYINAGSSPLWINSGEGAPVGYGTPIDILYQFNSSSLSPIVFSFRAIANQVSTCVGTNLIVEEFIPLSQNVNLASSFQEFAANSSTTTANDSTSFVNGATAQAGVSFQAFAPTGNSAIAKTVQFQNPIQPTDTLVLEINAGSGWTNYSNVGIGFVNSNGTTSYGATVYWAGSNQATVNFYSAGNPMSTWASLSSWKWRVRKISNGNWAESTFQGQVGAWTSYTPVWTSSGTAPSIGNGSIVGAYRRVGDSMELAVYLTMGSTSTFGSGNWQFSIPANYTISTSPVPQGMCGIADAQIGGVNNWQMQTWTYSSTTLGAILNGTWATATTPGTWAASNVDYLVVRATVPIAQWGSNINLATDFQEFLSCTGVAGVAANTTYSPTTVYGSQGSVFPAVTIASVTSTTGTTYNLVSKTPVKSTDKFFFEYTVDGATWLSCESCGIWVANLAPQAGGPQMGVQIIPNSTGCGVKFSNAGRVASTNYGQAAGNWAADLTGLSWRVRKVSNGNMAQQSTTNITTVMNNRIGNSSASYVPLNLSGTFTTSGGPVTLIFSGSCYFNNVSGANIGATIKVDGVAVGYSYASVPTSTPIHLPLPTKFISIPTLAAGSHTITLTDYIDGGTGDNTTVNWADLFSVVTEEFVPAGVITPQDRLTTIANTEIQVSGAVTATPGFWHKCVATSANYAITLPLASSWSGRFLGIRIDPSSTYLVTVTASGSDLIDGLATRVMWAKEVAELYSDGSSITKVGGKSIPMSCQMSCQTNTLFSAGTANKLPFASRDYDNTGTMMTDIVTNKRINILRSNLYQVNVNTLWNNNNASASELQLRVNISGSLFKYMESRYAGNNYFTSNFSFVSTFTAGAYVEEFAYFGTGSFSTTVCTADGNSCINIIEILTW